jgi:hypothetical protein
MEVSPSPVARRDMSEAGTAPERPGPVPDRRPAAVPPQRWAGIAVADLGGRGGIVGWASGHPIPASIMLAIIGIAGAIAAGAI